MKKAYQKPCMEVTEFRFAEHIAASGAPASCQWHSGADWSLAFVGCDSTYVSGTPYWTGLNG